MRRANATAAADQRTGTQLDEAAADYTRDLIEHSEAFDELVQKDRTVAQQFVESVKAFLKKVASVFTGKEARDRAVMGQFGTSYETLRKAAELWDKTLKATERQVERAESRKAKTKNTTTEGGVRLSVEDETRYAGKSLVTDGEVYSYAFLTSLPDMTVTMLPEVSAVRDANSKVDSGKVIEAGMKNARNAGAKRDGKVFVRNGYTGKQLLVTTNSIRHGLNGGINRLLTNARLGAVIGDVIKNAVPINAPHNKAEGVTGTYAMAAYAADSQGREIVAIVTVEQRNGNISGIEAYDVTHVVSGRQKKTS